MFELLGGALGLGSSIFGANKAAKAADADRRRQDELIARLSQVNFSPFAAMLGNTGFTGQGFQAGMFEPFLQQFQQGPQGIDAAQQLQGQANQGLFDILGNQGQAANVLSGQAFGQAGQLGAEGFQRGLQNTLFGQAQNLAGQTDFSGLRDQTLSTLREQAAPFEERAFGNLQQNLFSTGRLGSSGGALQTEAFARGLGQADLSRQLQATGVAQQQQMQNANIASQFAGTGQGIAGLENSLLNSAFQRFGSTTGLAADLNQQLFNRGGVGFNQGMTQLGGIGNIMSQLLDFGKFGANLGATQSNIDIAKAGGQANIMNNFGPTGGDIWGSFASSLGSNLLQGSGGIGELFSGLGGLFNKPNNQSGITGAPN